MSYKNPRLTDLNMSALDMAVLLAEGNPGACRVIGELASSAPEIDPDSALGPFGPLFHLDNLDCYGSRIWMFYKDVCGQDINKMMGVMRASQMGFTTDSAINAAIDGDKNALDIPVLLTKLKGRLPAFAIEKQAAVPAKAKATPGDRV